MTDSQTNDQVNPPEEPLAREVKPQSVARLLGVTLDVGHSDERDGDQMITELLGARLAAIWLPDNGRQGAWSRLMGQLLRRSGSDGRQTVGGLLLDSQAPLGTIRRIRDRAKAQAASESSEAEHAAMTMIYFAAIANALAYRGAKITTYSYESLESSFEKLIGKSWMPADFVEFFRRAAKVCQREQARLGSQQDGSLPQS